MMVKFGRTNHLSHPLCETLLQQKWLSYGFPIYMLNLCFYLLFVLVFSCFIVTFPACNHDDEIIISKLVDSCPYKNFTSFNENVTIVQILCIWYLILYCLVSSIFEVMQLLQDGFEYFHDIKNYVQWVLYISTSLFALPFLFNESWHYQWVSGSIGIFTAYFGLLFLLGHFHIYGIYVIMFLEIFKTLLHVLSLFSILIVGFALTFCVIRPFAQVIIYLRYDKQKVFFSFWIKSILESQSIVSSSSFYDYFKVCNDDVRRT